MGTGDDVERLRARAEHAPESIGRSEVSRLAECLDPNGDPDAVERALSAIAAVVERDPASGVPAVPAVVNCLDAGSERVRDRASSALVAVSRERPSAVASAVDRLVDRLDDEDDAGRRASVALVLARIAAAAPEAVAGRSAALVEAIDDELAVRTNLARAIAAVAEEDPGAVRRAVPDLVADLDAQVAGPRIEAARAVAAVADGAADAVTPHVDDLVAALEDPNPAVGTGAMRALAGVAVADPPAVTDHVGTLVSQFGTGDGVADAAVEAVLGAAVPDPAGTTQLLARALAEGDERTRDDAERALRGIAMRNPAPVVAAVAPLFDDPDPAVRRGAARMAATVGEHRPGRLEPLTEELLAALSDPDREVRETAATAVAARATDAPRTLADRAPEIAEAVAEDEWTAPLVRALGVVCGVDPDALDPGALPVETLATHEDPAVRAALCEVLGAAGGESALSLVRDRVEDPDREVQVAALGALATLAERRDVTLSAEERERIAEADVGDDD